MNNLSRICLMFFVIFLLWSAESTMAGTIKGQVKIKKVRSAKDVVVYIDNVDGQFNPPAEHAVMDQKKLAFIPHVLPIVKGTTVDFSNSDNVMHNVFTPDQCAGRVNLGTWSKGEARSYTFKNQGCAAVILCNLHPQMEAWVVVLQNPYFSKIGRNGRFTIENVPAGKYTLKVWHQKAAGFPQEVTVPQDGEVTVGFQMKRKR